MLQSIKSIIRKWTTPDFVLLNPILRAYYRYKFSADGLVVMLHRVGKVRVERLDANENLKLPNEMLEKMIVAYKKAGFDFVSLDEVHRRIEERRPCHRFISFTLDDGYVDNFTEAYPIFKKHNVPFCIYVATDYPNRKAKMWWYALEQFILDHNVVELSDGTVIQSASKQEKEEAFSSIRRLLLSERGVSVCDIVKDLIVGWNIDIEKYVETEALSWAQIEELSKDPLCTIGGHTVSHPVLSALTEDEVKREIKDGIDELSAHIKKPISHFAYPFGSRNEASDREYAIAESFGFKTIATTNSAPISVKHTLSQRLTRYGFARNNFKEW